jgi:peptidoglycan hydrolase-like protein with peptidoglycan-binding domain
MSADGADHQHIRQMQQALKESGYDPGPIDGVQGPQTTAALRAYQKAEGIEVTGRADTDTLGKLGVGVAGATAGSTASPRKKQTP